MKRFIIILMPALIALTAYPRSVDMVPNVHIEDARRFVSNPDGVLSPEAVSQLDNELKTIWDTTSAEVVLVAVDETDSGDVDDFATKLFEKWGIGKKDNDNGLLILISKNDRKVTLRTGYGLEGVLPDAVCGRIIRNYILPRFRNGDYDGGAMAAVTAVNSYLTEPEAAAEVMSKYANDSLESRRSGNEDEDVLSSVLLIVLYTGSIVLSIALILVFYGIYDTRGLDPTSRYFKLKTYKVPILMLGCLGLGLPFIAYFLLSVKMKRLRNSPRKCPNCSQTMHKLDEQHDNDYLTPAQDTEEKINSVDYDVWLCDNCGEKDIIPFVNESSGYTVCPQCGARACRLVAARVIVAPTQVSKGRGVREYTCLNCKHNSQMPYEIAKEPVTPVVIIPGGGRGFGGGGGFSGGSFGGGSTGGGGATGGW